jgi:outer membrane lipoprotein-sorting protein
MKRVFSLPLVFLFVGSIAFAQDFRQAIEDLHRRYGTAENLSSTMSIDAFESPGLVRPFYEEKVVILKKGTSYRHHLTSTDMVMNDHHIVMVDHSNRRILISKRDVKGEAQYYQKAGINIDSLLTSYPDAHFEGIEDNAKKFTVIQKTGDIQKIELLIDDVSGDLRQINYLYRLGQWVTIRFGKFNVSPEFSAKEFDEEQFVRKSGRSWQPAATLVGYTVVKANDSKAAFITN